MRLLFLASKNDVAAGLVYKSRAGHVDVLFGLSQRVSTILPGFVMARSGRGRPG